METVTQVNKQLQRRQKKQQHDDILPHVCLQSKWLIVDYFRRCETQRNVHFNANQMWRSEAHYHPLTCQRGHKQAQNLNFFTRRDWRSGAERNLISPTNSGVPKMFLNSFPALIWWAIPKSISLILGLGTFLSSSMMFSGWKIITGGAKN